MFARVNDGGGVQPVSSGSITNQSSARTRYARSGDAYIAYRVFGDGPRDIILVPGTISHADLYWELPANDYLLKRLSAFARVIVFDKRGQGLSDRVAEQTMEERLGDVRAVMDAAGSERATIYGWSEGGQLALMFAGELSGANLGSRALWRLCFPAIGTMERLARAVCMLSLRADESLGRGCAGENQRPQPHQR